MRRFHKGDRVRCTQAIGDINGGDEFNVEEVEGLMLLRRESGDGAIIYHFTADAAEQFFELTTTEDSSRLMMADFCGDAIEIARDGDEHWVYFTLEGVRSENGICLERHHLEALQAFLSKELRR